jgi:hypothetical protein
VNMLNEQQRRFLRARQKAQKRIAIIRKEKGLVYEIDDNSATFWKDGQIFASVKFRFGSDKIDELFKGKKRLKMVM